MRKIELVHLHALLGLLRRRLEGQNDIDDEAFADYEGLDVGPTQVYKPKDEQREAVLALSRGLADELAVHGKYRRGGEHSELTATRQ